MAGWSMGISAPAGAWGKDYFAALGMVSVDTLWSLMDKEGLANFDQEGNPKNPASKHDIDAYMSLYTQGANLPSGGVPPVIIACPKGHQCHIIDGRHRLAAARRLGLKEILTTVIETHPG